VSLPGRRTFIAASVLLFLVGCLHTVGHFTYKPTDPELIAIQQTLRAHHFPMGMGMAPSLFAIQNSLALTMSVALFWLALLGILVATADPSPRVLRRMTMLNVAGCGALVLLYAHYRIPPPLVLFAVVELAYVVSLLRQAMGMKR
jgi:hypothetical protein